MGKRIETKLEEVDVHLTKKPGKRLNVSGTVSVNFSYSCCYNKNIVEFVYKNGEGPAPREHKCLFCNEEYLVILEGGYPFNPKVEDREGLELHRKMKPIIDKIKKEIVY